MSFLGSRGQLPGWQSFLTERMIADSSSSRGNMRSSLEKVRAAASHMLDALGLKREAVLLANRLGYGGGLRTGDWQLDGRLFMRRSSAELRRQAADASGPKVLLAGPLASGTTHTITATMIGLALRLRGADARALFCDSALKACELIHAVNFETIDRFMASTVFQRCPACQRMPEDVFGGFEVPAFHLSRYLHEADYRRSLADVQDLTLPEILAYEYQGLDVGEHIRTSLHRFFLVGSLVDDDATHMVARRYLASAIQFVHGLQRLIDEWQPEVIVTVHGIYLMGGLALELGRHLGLRVAAWDLVYRRGSIRISHGETYHHELRRESWDAWENAQFPPDWNQQLHEYLAQRWRGGLTEDKVSYNEGAIMDRDRIARELGLDPGRRKVMLFTNVAWDGRVHVDSSLYQGPTEWVIDTIRYLADRQDLQVIVRIHPAEVKETAFKGLQRVDEEIAEAIPDLPRNVVLILPENPINSYALADMADVVIVYSTLMGLEALLAGKPVVIAGDAMYSNKGFGLQPRTRQQYLSVLDKLSQVGPPDQQTLERVRRYGYHLFFRRWLQLPHPVYHGPEAPVAKSLADLLPGESQGLDCVCEGILHGTPFHTNQ